MSHVMSNESFRKKLILYVNFPSERFQFYS